LNYQGFGLNLIPNEETKGERFENSLNPHIKERVMCHEIRNFVKLVDIASVAEGRMRESSTSYELKRGASQVTNPSKRPAQARVYTLTPVEVDEEEKGGVNNVVTGTIFLFDILACTLFDSGATHLFISEAYIKLRHVSTRPLVQNLTVETPGGKKVVCDKMVENCPIIIKGRNLPINLSVFKSLGYDVILGMDWLSKYYASITCREEVVVFQLPGVERFKFNGSCTPATPPLLSAIQATRNI
jgi:hypothetical protein